MIQRPTNPAGLLAVLGVLLATGCPVPSDDPARPGAPTVGPEAGAIPPGGGVLVDLKTMAPQRSQDQVKAADHIVVKGEVTGSCNGRLRLDVVAVQNPGGGTGGAPPSPLTSLDLPAPGPFAVAVPKGEKVNLAILCDVDGDGKITATGPDRIGLGAPMGPLDSDQEGVTLALQPAAQAGPSGGGGAGGPGAGGPPAPGPAPASETESDAAPAGGSTPPPGQ